MYSLNNTCAFVKKMCQLMMATVICILMPTLSYAVDCSGTACNIQVQFKGIYTQDTCDISINNGSSAETVNLPTLSTAGLQQDGAEAGSTMFNITLKSCPAGKTVMLKFVSGMSEPDTQTGNLQNSVGSGYSSNVQVRIRKSSNAQMRIDDNDTMESYAINASGSDVTHSFISSYYAKGSRAVSAGEVKAIAGIELYYK